MDNDKKAFMERQKVKESLMAQNPCAQEDLIVKKCLDKEPNCDEVLNKLYECQDFWNRVKNYYQRKNRSSLVLNVKDREKAKNEYLAYLESQGTTESTGKSS